MGDSAAFDALVKRHQHALQRFASRMLGGDSSSAADIAVGAFLRLWERRDSVVLNESLLPWLVKTVHRLCLDRLRERPSVELTDVGVSESPFLDLERAALASAARAAVMELSVDLRAVVLLSVYEGLSYEEIAEALDIPAGTVASRKNAAMKQLRRRLAAWSE